MLSNKDTGFRDVNKVPIKEGDVIKLPETEALYVVFWQVGEKTFKLFNIADLYDVVKYGIILAPFDYFAKYHPVSVNTDCEVIVRLTKVFNE